MRRRHAILGSGLAFVVVIVIHGCHCGKQEDQAPAPPAAELVLRRVPDTELVIGLPKGWMVDMPQPGPLPAPPPPGSKIDLRTRTLLQARPGTARPGTLVPPLLLVLEDPWLPVGTTGVDYLVAQRASNQAVIGTNIRHVEAEPSRRQGRPSYHVRDEWTVDGAGAQREVSQEALLLLESSMAPDRSASMHGYTVVITMEKSEFGSLQPLVREVLASVRFEERSERTRNPVDAGSP